jgi:hypothetical protein
MELFNVDRQLMHFPPSLAGEGQGGGVPAEAAEVEAVGQP